MLQNKHHKTNITQISLKIDVVDTSATTIDRSVFFLLPHLSSLKQHQTFVQELEGEKA